MKTGDCALCPGGNAVTCCPKLFNLVCVESNLNLKNNLGPVSSSVLKQELQIIQLL